MTRVSNARASQGEQQLEALRADVDEMVNVILAPVSILCSCDVSHKNGTVRIFTRTVTLPQDKSPSAQANAGRGARVSSLLKRVNGSL